MKTYNCHRYYCWGIDADNRLVKRYFRTRVGAETWAFANLVEIWRVEHV